MLVKIQKKKWIKMIRFQVSLHLTLPKIKERRGKEDEKYYKAPILGHSKLLKRGETSHCRKKWGAWSKLGGGWEKLIDGCCNHELTFSLR